MHISKTLGMAALVATMTASAALAQEGGQAPAPAMPDRQEMPGGMMGDGMMGDGMMGDGMMGGDMMGDGMMGGDMMGGDMQMMQQMGLMMETCMETMQAMNAHMQSHDHTGNDG